MLLTPSVNHCEMHSRWKMWWHGRLTTVLGSSCHELVQMLHSLSESIGLCTVRLLARNSATVGMVVRVGVDIVSCECLELVIWRWVEGEFV